MTSVAYFSMEIGIKSEIKTYSGGLGVLAGDTLKSAADLGLDFTGITLLYKQGYFKQVLKQGIQTEESQEWDFEELLEDTGKTVEVEIKGNSVTLKIWKYEYEGRKGSVDIYFLDSDLQDNSELERSYTQKLYFGNDEMRLCQEAILGIGGSRAVKEIGINPEYYHMNEGHSALLVLEAEGDFIFTTHTPVPAGHDNFKPKLVKKVLGKKASEIDLNGKLNMTELALQESDYQNAVSEKHLEVSKNMFPDYEIDSITNGIHTETWACKSLGEVFDDRIENWREDPQRLSRALKIPDNDIWDSKKEARRRLKRLIEEKTGKRFENKKFTIGFARRATSYKRPELIFKDIETLDKLGEKYGGIQLVFGGKAHPDDNRGKELIQKILEYGGMLENVEVFFIEDYGMEESKKMVSGVDLWLNNPKRGQEASGTSGMKAAVNGTPQLSILDGWWIEGHIEDVTGWSIGENYVEGENEDKVDSKSIYHKLDHIISLYENERQAWLKIMKNCIALNASYFNTQRMVREYATKAYK